MKLIEDPGLRRVLEVMAPDPVLGCEAMGVPAYVARRLGAEGRRWGEPIHHGLALLDGAALGRHGVGIAALADGDLAALIAEIDGQPWFAELAGWVAEAIYANPANGGNPGALSWREVGYRHGLPDGPDGPPPAPRRPPAPLPALRDDYDAIVVGSGAGGGIVASQLALAGQRVLLVERGSWLDYANGGHRDHLRNHRNPVHGHNTGPDPDDGPRVLVTPDGIETLVEPHTIAYGHNASCVGSGTVVYGAQAWRFHPDDFRMASRYGVPDGSSLVDWPFGYDDLEPWYAMAETEIGVAGDPGRLSHEPWRSAPLPMPRMPGYDTARVLRRGAAALGLETVTPPLLVNSVPFDGRAACIECGSCIGFPCPTDAKNGTQNTLLPKALASGNLTLATDILARRIETDSAGRVTGVSLTRTAPQGAEGPVSVRSRIVVLSAGAIETARLLLLSATAKEPCGLGNNADQVGRHLQGHTYPTALGLFDEPVHASRGPGVTIATTAYAHGNPGIVGGAMIADDFVVPPVAFWAQALPPGLRRWGQEAHDFMRANYRRVSQVKGPVHEIPSPDCRVQLDPRVRDKRGEPVARLSGVVHPETQKAAGFILERAKDWLRASGALRVWGSAPAPRLSAYQHQAGTCRMGTDPSLSVTDPFGRVWGHDNLFVADGSLHPTNGAFNPVLTIMALAFRSADHILSSLGAAQPTLPKRRT
ncbi:GMC family oxidoreductase [Rubellimicrobium arenae]|uniref:GMC family oxidoreductase n=1 Tax=Rubellimicrobium arenae TaxID=2817372 RepID=UPI001B3159EF|nr:GMC family oxidoreductase [Rubellimicrobium arenae]